MKGLTWPLILAITSAVIGSAFQHGYNTGVINAPQKYVKAFISSSYYQRYGTIPGADWVTLIFSVFVSIFSIGGMIGSLVTAYIAERFGRKGGLLINNCLVVISTIFFGLSKMAKSYEMLIIGRIIIGIHCGLDGGLGPMYLMEISPKSVRGAIGTIYQLFITISILVSQILGMPMILGNAALWPLLFAIIILPCMITFVIMPRCSESPKYLINCNKDEEAREALIWLRGTSNVNDEINEIKAEYEVDKQVPKVSLKEFAINPVLRRPLIISGIIMLAQQFSGINVVIYYSMEIFQEAGLSEDQSYYGTLGVGFTNVIVTIVSMMLVDRAGRRTLLLVGLGGMMVCTILLTVFISFLYKMHVLSYLSILSIILFVILFSIGPGSIPWFLVTELFKTGPRSTATSIAGALNWLGNFIVGLAFLPISSRLYQYTFLIFTVLLAIFWIYVYFRVPETKNKSINEIQEHFKDRPQSELGISDV